MQVTIKKRQNEMKNVFFFFFKLKVARWLTLYEIN